MSKKIWCTVDVDYIGATGVSTIREMAELAVADGGIADLFGIESDDPTVDQVEKALRYAGVQAVAVPTAYLKRERWNMSRVFPIMFDAPPGRGFVKVLGVSI